MSAVFRPIIQPQQPRPNAALLIPLVPVPVLVALAPTLQPGYLFKPRVTVTY